VADPAPLPKNRLNETRPQGPAVLSIRWTAERRDTCESLCAGTAGALVLKIRADYEVHPVPRDLPGRPRGGRGRDPGLTCG